jgi:hypothetical protein
MTTAPLPTPAPPMRNTSRNCSEALPGGQPDRTPASHLSPAPHCPVCEQPLPSARARYCSAACRHPAFRLRHPAAASTPPVPTPVVVALLRRQRALVAHTVYECPRCEERHLGVRQCPDCHLFCRAVGLGGTCPDCDAVILLVDLVGEEVLPADQ